MQVCFASHNRNKILELRKLAGEGIELLGLEDLGIVDEIPETGSTLQENALIKANYLFAKTKISCFADDTGLEVEALGGEPGVYSARYAGEPSNNERNIDKLLNALEGNLQRKARFRTVIAYVDGHQEYFFEGEVAGVITLRRTGVDGFGYDPIFLPNGFDRTFAEMTMQEKNSISHRGLAVRKLIDFLNNQ